MSTPGHLDQAALSVIADALNTYTQTLETAELFPTVVPEAAQVVAADPYAFVMATCLDRGTKAEIIWTIPYDLKNHLGHLDPHRIYQMSEEELAEIFRKIPRHPRYINDAPRTVKELTRIVIEECDGDAAAIWMGKRAAQVNRTFMSIHGVGPGIANMAVLLIESAYNIRFSDLDHARMDIKPDVHTKRVLYRLGVSNSETEQAAIESARMLSPSYPGGIDGALWSIGREFCHATGPNCGDCPLTLVCEKRIP